MATYTKSGTNWMMQIVYRSSGTEQASLSTFTRGSVASTQLIRTRGETLRGSAPDAQDWETSPERAGSNAFRLELLPYSRHSLHHGPTRSQRYFRIQCFVRDGFLARDAVGGHLVQDLYVGYSFMGGKYGRLLGAAASPNVLIVSFKSMKRDLKTTARNVAQFLK